MRLTRLLLLWVAVVAGGCGGGPVMLTFARPDISVQVDAAFDSSVFGFTQADPDVQVRTVEVDIGRYRGGWLDSVLTSETPPDVYLQWTGEPIRQHATTGLSRDLSRVLAAREIDPRVWTTVTHKGAKYLTPALAAETIITPATSVSPLDGGVNSLIKHLGQAAVKRIFSLSGRSRFTDDDVIAALGSDAAVEIGGIPPAFEIVGLAVFSGSEHPQAASRLASDLGNLTEIESGRWRPVAELSVAPWRLVPRLSYDRRILGRFEAAMDQIAQGLGSKEAMARLEKGLQPLRDSVAARRGPVSIRFAHTTTGGAERPVMTWALKEFGRRHPDIAVTEIAMDDDIYEDLGLITMFTDGRPPDVYSQWGGWLVGKYARIGYAKDLTDDLNIDAWGDEIDGRAWPPATWRGRRYMIPTAFSVTTLYWYDRARLADCGGEEPKSWDGLLKMGDCIRLGGRAPFAFGNREKWPLGNWAAHLVNRAMGDVGYRRLLSLDPDMPFTHSEVAKAFELIADAAQKKMFNDGFTALSDDEALIEFLHGRAVFLPLGNWIASMLPELAPPEMEVGGFNLPPLEGGLGDQTSIIGLTTGYMVSATTDFPDEALDLLRWLSSVEVQSRMVAAGSYSTTRAAVGDTTALTPALKVVRRIYESGTSIVPAPDVGFDPAMADLFYDAAAAIADGYLSVDQALERAQLASESLRRQLP